MIHERLREQGLVQRLDQFHPHPRNARKGNLDTIKESLNANGQYRSIVVNERTGDILAGNHTWKAAKELGWDEIAVEFIDADDEAAEKIVLVDNKANDDAGYDNEALIELLQGQETLEGTGFDTSELDELIAELGPGGFNKGEKDDAPPVPDEATSQAGEVYKLGNHMLYVGDAFELEPVDAGTVDLVFTDPPYMVSYQEGLTPFQAERWHRRKDGLEVTSDNLKGDDADGFIWSISNLVERCLKPGGAFYICAPPGPDLARFLGAFTGSVQTRQVIQWVKDQFVFGRQDYQWRNEAILYGWREGAGHFWCGDHSQDTVWEFKRPKRSKEHPTMKPVDLVARAIANSTRAGELVFDPFAGSGTTMVACMETNRRCVMVELDPRYADVIINRYERLTGQRAERLERTQVPGDG